MQSIYDAVSRRFESKRLQTLFYFWRTFDDDLSRIWNEGGVCLCTHQNALIHQLLLATGQFSEEDIRTRWGLAHFISPHQWLQVRVDGAWIDVDSWGRTFGIPLGKNAAGLAADWNKSWVEELE